GIGMLEERRSLNPIEGDEIHSVEKVGDFHGGFNPEWFLLLAVAVLSQAEVETLAQAQIYARISWPAPGVARQTCGPVVHHRIVVVIQSGRDVEGHPAIHI